MIDLLLIICIIALNFLVWLAIWHVGVILIPVGVVVSIICYGLIRDL